MKKAFTLVELLVAVLLLTLLIGTALFSYRQVLLNITKAQTSTFNEVLKVHQIRTSIESMQHYVVDEYNQFNQPMKKLHTFFLGNPHYFKYISLNPTLSTIPSLSAFECKNNTLVYREEPLYKRIDVNRPKFLEDTPFIVYWEDIQSCQFEYILYEKVLSDLKNKIPTAIKIDFIDRNEKKHTFFTHIQSDYNITSAEMYGLLYEE
ncbi:MAG: prepilin-type N-terminal cleavage/methylation domain-containing protein [Campylobacterota bacterium]|nr:prepilin-type N-terminal cleavage/methylation domain-containing protein [Campylobacterota bacterium]